MELCEAGASTVDSGAVLVRCKGEPQSEDPEDAADFGEIMMACALGVTARPYPADATGAAQLLVDDRVSGQTGVAVGARDTRNTAFLGNLAPGDTVLHSTGPEQAAAVFCKEVKHQVVGLVKDASGKNAAFVLDGKKEQFTFAGFGLLIEASAANGIVLNDGKGAYLQLKDGFAILGGKITSLGGRTPLAPVISGAAAPGIPTPGVFVGS